MKKNRQKNRTEWRARVLIGCLPKTRDARARDLSRGHWGRDRNLAAGRITAWEPSVQMLVIKVVRPPLNKWCSPAALYACPAVKGRAGPVARLALGRRARMLITTKRRGFATLFDFHICTFATFFCCCCCCCPDLEKIIHLQAFHY